MKPSIPGIAPFVAITAIAGVAAAGMSTTVKVGDLVSGGVVVPTGDVIKPVGTSLLIDRRPVATLLSATGETLYVRDNDWVDPGLVGWWSTRRGRGFTWVMRQMALMSLTFR